MMLKLKIYSTILVVYEIVAVMLLHCPRMCNALMSGKFCMDSIYKYFVFCFAIPALVSIIAMWIMAIVNSVRRRHSLLYRAQSAVEDVAYSLQRKIRESVSGKDLEKYIIAAVLAGVKKYSDAYPNIRRAIDNIIGVVNGDDDTMSDNAAHRVTHTTKSKSVKKKKK